jgi:3-hydroxyacyl-[acyl-carrier-protein] dehydratase
MRFLLVDRISNIESGESISGVKNASLSEDFFTHHFPQLPIMPGMLIVESMVQLGRWLIAHETNFECGATLTEIEDVKFRSYVAPGDQLLIHLSRISREDNESRFSCEARVDGALKARAKIRLHNFPLSQFEEPLQVRRMFHALYRPTDGKESPWRAVS